MNREAYKLARDTLRMAVREYGWSRYRSRKSNGVPLNGYVYGPGKFEGEHWSIVHYWDAMMNGCGDEPLYEGEDCVADIFEVSDVERAAFALSDSDQFAIIWHSPQGFESLEYVDADQYDRLRERFDNQT